MWSWQDRIGELKVRKLVEASINWSRGVTVSTLDSESSDRGSNSRGTFCVRHCVMSVGGHSQAGPNRAPTLGLVFKDHNKLENLLSEASHATPQHWILVDEACEVAL